MVITYHTEVRFRCIIYREAWNWTTEALEKFKWSKLVTWKSNSGAWYTETLEIEQRKLSRNWNSHNFTNGSPIQAHIISRSLKFNNGSSREIQMVITYHTEVRFNYVIYRDARNWTNESSREIQMVISYHTEVRFKNITYWDARNWTTEALKKFKWS